MYICMYVCITLRHGGHLSQGNGFDLRYDVCICIYARGIMNTMLRTAEAKNMSGGMFEYGGRHMNELTRIRIDALI